MALQVLTSDVNLPVSQSLSYPFSSELLSCIDVFVYTFLTRHDEHFVLALVGSESSGTTQTPFDLCLSIQNQPRKCIRFILIKSTFIEST